MGSRSRCPRCGEHEVVWVNHGDEENSHQYCTNCDNGCCEDC